MLIKISVFWTVILFEQHCNNKPETESLLKEEKDLNSNKEIDFILSTQGVILQESINIYKNTAWQWPLCLEYCFLNITPIEAKVILTNDKVLL